MNKTKLKITEENLNIFKAGKKKCNNKLYGFVGWVAKQYGIRTRTIFTWCKSNPVPSFRKVNYPSATEYLWVGSKGTKAWVFNFKQQKEMKNFMITANGSVYKETEHPTEKPKELVKHLLEIHSNKGDLVLDCFGGSGTTAICCKELGRNFIIFELSENYCKMAEKRLSQESLFPLAINKKEDYGLHPTSKEVGIRPTIL